MLNFNAKPFYEAVAALQFGNAKLEVHFNEKVEDRFAQNEFVGQGENLLRTRAMLEGLRYSLAVMNAKFTKMRVDSLLNDLQFKYPTFQDLKDAFKEIDSRLVDELSVVKMFVTEKDDAKFYDDPILFGEAVDTAFPSASPEIAEAGKCFALSRYSATVFHLMRSLEVGLRCLAIPFQVDVTHKNWHSALDQIAKAVRAIDSVSNGPNWKDDQQFFSEAITHFRDLKDSWRNYCMHEPERYSEERARDIYNNVRAFMRHLAARLHEPVP
jgi:hypothetical protein